MKKLKFAAIYIPLTVLLFFLKIILVSAGTVPDEMMGFDVDEEGNLWIGRRGRITVYKDGEVLRTVTPPTSRDYSFFLQEDKMIVHCATTYEKIEEYDLSGNYLGESLLNLDEFKATLRNRDTIERNGNLYVMKKYGGIKPYEVFCNGERIYQMSTSDYIFNGFPNTVFRIVSMVILVFLVLLILSDEDCLMLFNKNTGDG